MAQTEAIESMGGFLDLLHFWKNGTIADAMELAAAVQAKDVTRVRAAVLKVLNDVGPALTAEAGLVDTIVGDLIATDWAKSLYDAGGYMQFVAVHHLGYVVPGGIVIDPSSPIRVMGVSGVPFDVYKATNAEAKQFLADNRASVRQAGGHWFTTHISRLRNAPEILKLARGEATTADLAAIDPARLETIMLIIEAAIPVLTLAGAFFPPLLILSSILRLIDTYYRSVHPKTATTISAEADKGLSLADLL